MLQKIKITNFKKHKNLELSFTGGTNLVLGKNWAGKSSVLWAVVYALFGPSAVPGGSKLVAQFGGSSKPSVTLSMALGNDLFEITRSPDKVEAVKNGVSVASGASPVTEYVESLLGMTAQDFTTIRLAQQNEAAAILTLGTQKLGQIINQVTRTDLVEKIIERASLVGSVLQKRLEGEIQKDLEQLANTLSAVSSMLYTAEHNLQQAQESLQSANETKAAAQQELAAANQEISEYQRARSSADRTIAQINQLRGKRELVQQSALMEIGDSTRLENVVVLLTKYAKMAATLSKYAEDEVALKASASSLQSALNEARPLDTIGAEKVLLAEQADALKVRSSLLDQQITQLSGALKSAMCPTCLRPFEDHDPEALATELAGLREEKTKVVAELAKTEQSIKPLQVEQAKVSDLSQRHRNILWMLSSNASAQAADTEEFNSVRDSVWATGYQGTLQQAQDDLATLRSRNVKITEARWSLTQIERDLLALEGTIPEVIEPDPDRQPKAAEQFSAADAEVKRLIESRHASHSEVIRLTLAKDAAERELASATAEEESRKIAEASLANHKKLLKYLRDNRSTFTTKVWETILSRCSAFVSSATGGQITEMSRTSEGQFQYLEEGIWMPVGAASGVQQAVLGVGVRLALVEALRAPGAFLLLDEVTAGSHDDLSIEIVRALKEAQDQIILVSHRQTDAAVADNLIEL